ncbi:helicase HerA-like domain-containing protein [Kitasatospora cheerisanensis]|uniref:ATPase n=1 Tax=Kitasatospora cheerisanensis KCTC 2395 TaxID=1348663 RepID=A0A066Z0W9_9ACTN|nr:helicase HerA-like domain-containing protein [Kitasatospora cheerisanensis]KDN83991.1 ATPase [Kitasatospora cheerisanensis KCTC 2395]
MTADTEPAALPEPVARIAAGYAFTGPALDLGAVLQDGTAYPAAQVRIPLGVLNRHGLVAGATGTGKTKTLQLIAEQLSAAGVPVFLADIKGDVSGIAAPGRGGEKLTARAAEVGQDWTAAGCPAEFLSLGGQGAGTPVRATVTSFGPLLLAKVLELNETQEASLSLVFSYADRHGLELYDLKDLSAVISFLTSPEGKEELKGIGGLSAATAGVILRSLTLLENQGAAAFFGEPEFDTSDLLRTADDGRGLVSVLELPAVQDRPRLFSTFLMWLLADLYQHLPEVGDLDRPKLVFFFDEAHLLFKGASKAFQEAITQTVRLIRSKGVGIFFVTQTPKDVPADVLAQLGNRVQHALRAYTPDDAKALKATVSTFPRSEYDLAAVLTGLGTGEAVVTVLSEKGAPTPVAATRLRAPRSLMGPLPEGELAAAVGASGLNAKYRDAVDRESAYEKLAAARPEPPAPAPAPAPAPEPEKPQRREKEEDGMLGSLLNSAALKSFARSAGTQLGREISRSLFGTAKRRR